ncbi:unnamed protein product [Chironomus riparius]|uniref:Calpain catalytic domain-containing protein n=1 Tax=Chironomus riparius TaxID=315576 RepID=A0A9P0IXT0_9DIPT|nr:unnamed protein product [Chironomus riparius]
MQNRRYTFDDQPIYLLGERACGVRGYNNIQDFYVIRKQCLDTGTLFNDPEFHLSGRCVRPKDICDNPLFLINKTSSFDVRQGRLSEFWFLSAVASLSLNEKLFNRVVCDDNSFDNNYAGIFHFRFWQYARWVDVVIDDRLPANGNELVNLHSTQRNEFWLCLLEKAYAKLYGSYEALHAGMSCEAFEDFTGGVSEIYNLKGVQNNFYGLIEKAFERHSMITCFKNEAAEGLIRIHAYSIIKVKSFQIPNKEEKLQLLQFRNSSEDETEWIKTLNNKPQVWHKFLENEKKLIGLTVEHDNEFWISYQDFIKHFDRLDICILSASSLELEKDSIKCDLSLFEGQWMKEFSAGGCNNNDETFHLNPQYVLTLESSTDSEEHCQVTITLIQKNRRTRESTPPQFLVIGFSIYCVSELQLQQKPFKKEFFETTHCHHAVKFTNSRRVTDNCNLSAGNYVIVPSTFDPNEEGEFVLRVYSDNKHTLKEHDKDVEIKKVNPKIVEAHKVEKLFFDAANSNQEVGWGELKIILDSSIPKGK